MIIITFHFYVYLRFILLFVLLLVLRCSLVGFFGVHFSCVPPTCESKAACKFSKNHQKEAPTASGIGGSDAPGPVVLDSRPEIAVRVEKVGFRAETFLL